MLWRTCKYCAAVRQFKIADKAEILDNTFDQLYLSVIKPHDKTAAALQRIRAAILRRGFTSAGLWSIETGAKLGGLHLNIIAPAPVAPLLRGCETWAEVITTSGRAAAAYINKPSGFPERAEYGGNLTGSWSTIPGFFTGRQLPATVQAASIEAALSKHQPEDYLRQALAAQAFNQAHRPATREEFREVARRNLPNLYAALNGDVTP